MTVAVKVAEHRSGRCDLRERDAVADWHGRVDRVFDLCRCGGADGCRPTRTQSVVVNAGLQGNAGNAAAWKRRLNIGKETSRRNHDACQRAPNLGDTGSKVSDRNELHDADLVGKNFDLFHAAAAGIQQEHAAGDSLRRWNCASVERHPVRAGHLVGLLHHRCKFGGRNGVVRSRDRVRGHDPTRDTIDHDAVFVLVTDLEDHHKSHG